MALPNLLTSVLNPGPQPVPTPAPVGGNVSRKQMLLSAERENWPDFLRVQYGLPRRAAQISTGPAQVPLTSGVANQFPLLSALLGGNNMGAGLNRVGNGGAMGGLAPSFTAPAVSSAAPSPALPRNL